MNSKASEVKIPPDEHHNRSAGVSEKAAKT
jgi:hypothetical protein